MQKKSLKEIKGVDINTVDFNTLVDIRDVNLDTYLTKEDRIKFYINQIENPNCYCYGNMIVKLCFYEADIFLEQRLKNYILLQIQI